jgi:hypothetical protein
MLQKNIAEEWRGVIADLTAKRQAAVDETTRLRDEKKALALEAAMGGGDAQKRLKAVNAELATAALKVDDWDQAVLQAESQLSLAEEAAAAARERARQEQISSALADYFAEVRGIDAALESLAEKFAGAKAHLDVAENLMDGRERRPIQQLRTQWGSTQAAAYFGLDTCIELGPAAGHVTYRQPLAKYAMSFIDRWVKDPPVTKEAA